MRHKDDNLSRFRDAGVLAPRGTQQLVVAGLTPIDAIRTPTYNPAQFLGLLDMLGTIEPGKLSEMVLLDANPLDDITNTTKINIVFIGSL